MLAPATRHLNPDGRWPGRMPVRRRPYFLSLPGRACFINLILPADPSRLGLHGLPVSRICAQLEGSPSTRLWFQPIRAAVHVSPIASVFLSQFGFGPKRSNDSWLRSQCRQRRISFHVSSRRLSMSAFYDVPGPQIVGSPA